MSYPSRRIFNRLFDEIQSQIKAKNPAGVMERFGRAKDMMLAKTIMPIEYEYLLTGVDPNGWLPRVSGDYKRYKKDEDAPVYWLHTFPDPKESGFTLGQIALKEFNDARDEVIRKIEADRPKPRDYTKEYEERMVALGLATEGTPFGNGWTIKPPGKERD